MRKYPRVQTIIEGESLTHQQFKDQCDRHLIVSRYLKTGHLPTTQKQPFYGDFSNVSSYQDALDVVSRGEEMFNALPSTIRGRFNNDPVELINFVEDPRNFSEAIRLGLLPDSNVAAAEQSAQPIQEPLKGNDGSVSVPQKVQTLGA